MLGVLLYDLGLSWLGALVHWFPMFSVPAQFADGLSAILYAGFRLNAALPVAEMSYGLGVYLSAWILMVTVRIVIFLYRLIPFNG